MAKKRILTAWLELPNDGSMKYAKIVVRSDDGKDLTYQAILDAVSDCLIEEAIYDLPDEAVDEMDYDA